MTGPLSIAPHAGLPMFQALTSLSSPAGNAGLAGRLLQRRGATMAGLFPSLAPRMLAVGEDASELTQPPDRASGCSQRELDRRRRNLLLILERRLIIVIGAAVPILGLGVFLPLSSIIGRVGGHGG
jgi:type II secretory pathway component PulF